ncbi:MAG TPA: hypothetical protein VED01_21835 [Burkholderiales bacterium]|nr:hypothetical protein [Burkholderiales bacterium]
MPQQDAVERRRTERRKEWNFLITDQGWAWALRKGDGTEERSSHTYPTLKAAADDAMVRGFAEWRREERRTGERRDTEH